MGGGGSGWGRKWVGEEVGGGSGGRTYIPKIHKNNNVDI